MYIATVLGHYKLQSSFPSTARMQPPEILHIYFYYNENFSHGCANSKVRSCVPGHTHLMFQCTIFIAVLVR